MVVLAGVCLWAVGCDDTLKSAGTKPPSPDLSAAPAVSEAARQADSSAVDTVPLIAVTPRATAMIRKITADTFPGQRPYLRLSATAGGCTGVLHKLDLDLNPTPGDYIVQSGSLKVVVWNDQVEMLKGSEIDYGEMDGKSGFKVKNPNFEGEAATKWIPVLAKQKHSN
jgi:iron-sulfur cluster assembly accessory protein